jgi:hypothetical protein
MTYDAPIGQFCLCPPYGFVGEIQTPNASIEAGYSHSIALCLNVAAIQTGQKVTFDDKTQQVMAGGKVYA